MTKAGLGETSPMRPKGSRSGRAQALALLDEMVTGSTHMRWTFANATQNWLRLRRF